MLVTMVGQHHGLFFTFCGCSTMAERLLACELWPATPNKPQIAFTLPLMNKIHYLVLECQIFIHDIFNFLRLSGKPQSKVRFYIWQNC